VELGWIGVLEEFFVIRIHFTFSKLSFPNFNKISSKFGSPSYFVFGASGVIFVNKTQRGTWPYPVKILDNLTQLHWLSGRNLIRVTAD